ncbi:ABC transporter ATP-binding protein [Tahibacter amnicola]|uniref:ABC transporter ATP-binding protein/permease n=1 Tax=Tahibacter amnicola TaxID=2976241 RepID=A0ABY6BJ14_9GAMM|nr:ABC transporter ATP-binding protein [Tahibacter amnicola]UXI69752.1 ABC transporter ATP-binding protein/permease [Tahibacter amnicola]
MTSSTSSFAALWQLIRYARPYRARLIAASLCSVANKLFDVAPEILIGIAIDVVVRGQQSFVAGFGVTDPLDQVYLLGGLTLAIWIFESLFEFAYLVLWRNLAQDLQHELRTSAFAHVQNLDLAYFEDRSSGGLVSILNDDVNQLERFLNGGASDLIQVVVTVIACGAVFFAISPQIAVLAFTPIPVILWGAFFFQRKAGPRYDRVREKVAALSGRLANNLAGIATVRSFGAEQRELARLQTDSLAYVAANRHAIRLSSAFVPLIRMAILFGFLCTFVRGGQLVLEGHLQAGFYAVLVFLTQRLLWPLTRLAETVDLFERAMASTRRILGLLATPIHIADATTPEPAQPARGDIRLDQVHFAYANGNPVLHGVTLDITAGTTVALVGATGGGKSSLIKLLLRFYEPTQGQIFLDGRPLASYPLAWLRSQIGWVAQDVFLFEGSVRDNIAYGRPGASESEIVAAAMAAEAHEFITRLPQGYDTPVGERGIKLSGGQRQRLSIARALLKDPPILLLDEATSAVDNETEAAIQRSLARLAHQRTVIVIAHRLSTIVQADAVVVVEDGRIVEAGRHRELIGRAGSYAALWKVQTGAAAQMPEPA